MNWWVEATKITPRPRNGFRFSHTRFFEPASETTSVSQNDWLIVRPLRGLVDDILLVFCAESAHEIDDDANRQDEAESTAAIDRTSIVKPAATEQEKKNKYK